MKLPLTRKLFFTGFMASGKSRIGALTAASLGWKFVDTDKAVEEKTGKTVAEIFSELGETEFRRFELEALRDICNGGHLVASLGGGTLLNPEAIGLIKQHGVLVALHASPEVILERVNRKKDSRPLLAGMEDDAKLQKIRDLLETRKPLYDQADLHFESEETIAHHILTRRVIHRLQIEELKPLWVELGDSRYPIYIEQDLSDHVDSIAEKMGCTSPFAIASDQNVKSAQGSLLERMRISLGNCAAFYWKEGESEKSLMSIQKLLTWLLRHGFSRNATIIACGGGVVGDMAGFAASIFLRGVNFIQVPTTLLSMVDSSVGGKTGVNHPMGKNLIGTFHQPRAVIINLQSLESLPRNEYLAGLAEVVKYAIIHDVEFFKYLESHAESILKREAEALRYIILRSCEIKAAIVGQDEKERLPGGRAILNYGHTFGHAFEYLSDFKMSHGLAIALGMRCAARLSVLMGIFSKDEELRHNRLLDKLELPKIFPGILDLEKAWHAMALDKKVEHGKRVFIVPLQLGKSGKIANPPQVLVEQAIITVRGND